MDALTAAVADFIRAVYDRPFPADMPTAAILRVLRRYLDDTAPGWREAAFADAAPGSSTFVVEFHLRGGRVVKGVLYQRASRAA